MLVSVPERPNPFVVVAAASEDESPGSPERFVAHGAALVKTILPRGDGSASDGASFWSISSPRSSRWSQRACPTTTEHAPTPTARQDNRSFSWTSLASPRPSSTSWLGAEFLDAESITNAVARLTGA